MTQVKVNISSNHITFSFLNHADSSRVCTAISTLACTLANAVEHNPEAVCVYQKMEPGYTKIEYIAQGDSAAEDARVILIGLLALEADYPEDVRVEQNIL